MTDSSFVIGGQPASGWLGLGPARLGVLAAGLLVTIMAATAHTTFSLAGLPTVAAAVWCFTTRGGVPLHDLATARARSRARICTGGHHSRSSLTVTPIAACTTGTRSAPAGPALPRLPAACGRYSLREVEAGGIPVGILLEPGRQGLEAVCVFDVVGDPGFALHSIEQQHRQVSGWGAVLTALAGQYGHRCAVQWHETSRSGVPTLDHGRGDSPGDGTGDLPGLADQVSRDAVWHRVTIALRIRTSHRDAHAALADAQPLARLFASRMLSAGLVAAPCDPDQVRAGLVAAMSGARWDPTLTRPGTPGGVGSFREAWDHLRVDDTWHRSYLISGWPRTPVGPAWLAPLLSDAPSLGWRSVTVHLQPLRPDVAARRARARRQHALLDAEDRARLGFSVGARERHTQLDAELAEDELAAGHVAHRMAGLVLVSGRSEAELADAARHTLATAAAARLELTPLHGRQLVGWAASLPLCRIGHRSPA